jgi:hypothetical protein
MWRENGLHSFLKYISVSLKKKLLIYTLYREENLYSVLLQGVGSVSDLGGGKVQDGCQRYLGW